eukprot:TRINITY_DN13029_c0_g1_i1.p1 TRINITY_DN13029_c0_g1~~TRINITY_DN13029_c0_g1_i1.p1  ORF type:complete len:197 (+),score=54.29 TRINITY_DN13029_c0_g1_i1:92-682(+)
MGMLKCCLWTWGIIFWVVAVVIGCTCLPFSFRTIGKYDRVQGLCQVNNNSVAFIPATGYRPVFNVSIFALPLPANGNITYLYKNVAAYAGPLTGSALHASADEAMFYTNSYGTNGTFRCIYPTDGGPSTFPTGTFATDVKVAMMGVYTDQDMKQGKDKWRGLFVSGLFFVSLAGVGVIIVYVIFVAFLLKAFDFLD